MKNLKNSSAYLTLLVLTLFILSCSKDDDNSDVSEPANQELILGKWSLKSISPGAELSGCVKQSSLIFLKEGTMIQSYYSENSDGDCELSNTPPVNYSFSSDDLIVLSSPDSDPTLITIVSIVKKELVIQLNGGSVINTITLIK